MIKSSPADAGHRTQVPSLGQEDPQEEEMPIHSSMLAWKIPWTEEPGGLQSTGPQRVRHYRAHTRTHTYMHAHTHPHTLSHTHTDTHTHTHTHTPLHTHTHTPTHTHTYPDDGRAPLQAHCTALTANISESGSCTAAVPGDHSQNTTSPSPPQRIT